jgi:hypothetical protein
MLFDTRIQLLFGGLLLAQLLDPVPGRAAAASGGDAASIVLELGLDVATGSYGNPVSTTTVSIPFSFLYLPTPRIDLGLMIAYLRQSNDLVVGGRVVHGAANPRPRNMMANRSEPVQGVGDLVCTAGYLVVKEGDLLPQVRAIGAVKFPTADDSLGTGAFDESLGLALAKSLDDWYLYLGGNYTFQGSTSLFTARNFANGEVGVGYEVLPGLRPSLGLRGATSAESGSGGTALVEGKLVYAASRAVDMKLYLDRGLSTSSATWQGGCSLGYNF